MGIKSVKYMERRAGEMYEFLELTFEVEADTIPMDQHLALCKEYSDAAFLQYKKSKPVASSSVVTNSQLQRTIPQAPQKGVKVTQPTNTGVEVPKGYWDMNKQDWKAAAAYLGTLVPQYIGNYGTVQDPTTKKWYILVKPWGQKPQKQAYQPPVQQPQQDFSGMPDHNVFADEDSDLPF